MALELEDKKPKPKPATIPSDFAELTGQILKKATELEATSDELERAVGEPTTPEHGASGLWRAIEALQQSQANLARTVGQPPNPATDEPGSGLCGVVAKLAAEQAGHQRRTVTRTTGAVSVAVVALELVARLLLPHASPVPAVHAQPAPAHVAPAP
jgi:hypothetical protein